MSLISSWTRQGSFNVLVLALTCAGIAVVCADEASDVRLGPNFRSAHGRAFQQGTSVSDVLVRMASDMQLFVLDVDGCPELVTIPPGKELGRDPMRETSSIIQRIRVACWSIMQAAPGTRVMPATAADRITPGMIHGIMDSSIGLSESDAEWGKALMTFPGGEITDIGNGRLVLSRPDGRNPPEQSLEFYLILAMAEERFIMVTQLINGQSTFIYGIHWRETPDGGEVVAIFPDILR